MTNYLDDLATTVASITASVTPAVVRLGGWRGANGVVVGPGAVLTNAHNVRSMARHGRRSPTDAGRRGAAGRRRRGRRLAVSRSTPATSRPSRRMVVNPATSARRVRGHLNAGAAPGHVRAACRASARRLPRPPRPPHRRLHRTYGRHGPGQSGSALVDARASLHGLNTNRLEWWLLPRAAGRRVAAIPRRRPAARRERRRRPRLGIGIAPARAARRMRARSDCPSRTACWCGTSTRTATRHAPASPWATSSWPRMAGQFPMSTPWPTRSRPLVAPSD